jgi:hypothetical protein
VSRLQKLPEAEEEASIEVNVEFAFLFGTASTWG